MLVYHNGFYVWGSHPTQIQLKIVLLKFNLNIISKHLRLLMGNRYNLSKKLSVLTIKNGIYDGVFCVFVLKSEGVLYISV